MMEHAYTISSFMNLKLRWANNIFEKNKKYILKIPIIWNCDDLQNSFIWILVLWHINLCVSFCVVFKRKKGAKELKDEKKERNREHGGKILIKERK